MVFRHSWLDIRVDISQKPHSRIWRYVPHFDQFNVLYNCTNFHGWAQLCASRPPVAAKADSLWATGRGR